MQPDRDVLDIVRIFLSSGFFVGFQALGQSEFLLLRELFHGHGLDAWSSSSSADDGWRRDMRGMGVDVTSISYNELFVGRRQRADPAVHSGMTPPRG